MPKENELKYSLSKPAWDALLGLERLGPWNVGEAATVEVTDVYADTADRAIRRGGFAFRIRTTDKDRMACLKSLGRGDGVAHLRDEHECSIGAALSSKGWPKGETRNLFETLTGGRPVTPEVEIRQTRTKRMLRSASSEVAEMSLDDVRVHGHGPEHSFLELEVELQAGAPAETLEEIHRVLSAMFDLKTVRSSKYERALSLVGG